MAVNTRHLAQVTGTPAFLGASIRGVDLGASAIHKGRCFIFFGDVPQVDRGDDWGEPWRLAPQGSAVPGPICASSRHPNNLDVVWIGPDGGVEMRSWNGRWGDPWRLAPPGSAVHGALATSSRHAENFDVFWIGPDGGIGLKSWNGSWGEPWRLAPPGSAVPGALATSSRHAENLDVFWIGPDGGVGLKSWNGSWGEPWRLAPPDSAVPGALATSSRHAENLDVFWIGPDGGVGLKSWNGSWGEPWRLTPPGSAVPGALATSSRHAENLDVFWIGPDGGIGLKSWDGSWGEPWRLALPGSAIAGSLATSSRHAGNLDVFWIGPDGGVGVRSWNGSWGEVWRLAPQGIAVPRSLTADSRHTENVDVFWVEPDRGVGVRSWNGGGPVSDADAVAEVRNMSASGVTLEPVLEGGVFAAMTIRKPNGFLLRPQSAQTPTGAFSRPDFVYVFWLIHDKPRDPQLPVPVSYLTRTDDPASGKPYDEVFRWSLQKFWQVAPWVVANDSVAGLPSGTGEGLVMLGGGAADGGGDAVHLAWMPLSSDRVPQLSDIRYYGGPIAGWSGVADESFATPLFRLPGGYTSISVVFIEAAGRWVALYSRATSERPDDSVVARTAPLPIGPWSEEIKLFNPHENGACGHFMRCLPSDPLDVPDTSGFTDGRGLAYGPFILSALTRWHPEDRTLELHYLLSTWRPYQVHHMSSRFALE